MDPKQQTEQPEPPVGDGLERASSLEDEQPPTRDVDPPAEEPADPSKD